MGAGLRASVRAGVRWLCIVPTDALVSLASPVPHRS